MNKKLAIFPLLSTFILFGCGGSDPTPTTETYKVTINTSGTELKPDIKWFEFKKDDFKPVTITYSGSDMHTIDTATTSVTDAADIVDDRDNKTLTITPKINQNFVVNVALMEIKYTVHFHADEYCQIEGHEKGEDVELSVVKNNPWGATKLDVINPSFTFNGWSLDSSGYGEVISNDYKLTSDLDVYPSYVFEVEIDGDGADVYKIGGYTLGDNSVTFRIKVNDERHYEFNEQCGVVVKSGGTVIEKPTIDFTKKEITLTKMQIEGNVTITINKKYQPIYEISSPQILSKDHIQCNFYAKNPKKGDDFSFDLLTKDSSGETTEFQIPDTLNITVNGKELFSDAYKITKHTEYPTCRAYVTIFGKYVTGDIVVNAVAKQVDYFNYTIHNYGTIEKEISSEETMNPTGSHYTDNEFQFYIYDNANEAVTAENVVVSIDAGDYITAKEESRKGDRARFTFNDNDSLFCLKGGIAKDSLEIFVREPKYQILEDLTWDQIKLISDYGIAKDLFYVGDTKKVSTTYSQTYTVRIIDFDHDDITDSDEKAGITFEFEQLLSDKTGKTVNHASYSNYNQYKFKDSYYNTFLNKDFKETIDSNLSEVVKTVDKKAANRDTGNLETYSTQFFPLGGKEIDPNFFTRPSYNDGELYAYYKYSENNDRIKCPLNDGGNPAEYWLRTVNNSNTTIEESFVIGKDGVSKNDQDHREHKCAFTAAFCI